MPQGTATLADLLPVDDDQPSTSGKATLADLLPDTQVNARLKVPAPDTSLLGTAGRLGQGLADNLTALPRTVYNLATKPKGTLLAMAKGAPPNQDPGIQFAMSKYPMAAGLLRQPI